MTVKRDGSEHPVWLTILAFAAIYLLWGSTYLAVRIGVQEVPPLLFASMRFLPAGLALFAWGLLRGDRLPAKREWRSICIIAVLIFVVDYGNLFWAEQRVPSGIAAVMMSTVPAFTALSEIAILRTMRLTARLAIALLIGFSGIVVLMSPSLKLGGAAIDTAGAIALIVASGSWSVSSALSRKLPLPESKVMSSAAQMLVGGFMLALTAAAFGELGRFAPHAMSAKTWWSLLYLVVAGSLISFTAYVWLLDHVSPTKVGTYAYVNPVIAVLVGYAFGGEAIGPRTIAGSLCVLVSVVLITTGAARSRNG